MTGTCWSYSEDIVKKKSISSHSRNLSIPRLYGVLMLLNVSQRHVMCYSGK